MLHYAPKLVNKKHPTRKTHRVLFLQQCPEKLAVALQKARDIQLFFLRLCLRYRATGLVQIAFRALCFRATRWRARFNGAARGNIICAQVQLAPLLLPAMPTLLAKRRNNARALRGSSSLGVCSLLHRFTCRRRQIFGPRHSARCSWTLRRLRHICLHWLNIFNLRAIVY